MRLELIVTSLLVGSFLLRRLDLEVDLVGAVLVDELDQALLGAVALVIDHLVGLSLEKLEGREARDLEAGLLRDVVLSTIHLGDYDLVAQLLGLDRLTKLGPDRSQALAVTAPGSIHLEEDVLALVHNELVELLGHDDLDGLVVLGRNVLGLEGGSDLTRSIVIHESLDLLLGDLLGLVKGILGTGVNVLDRESGPLLLQAEVTGVGTVLGRVNVDKVDLALVLLSHGLDRFNQGLALLLGLGKEISKRQTRFGIEAKVGGVNLIQERDRVGLDEGLHLGLVQGTRLVVAALIKLLVHNKRRQLLDLVLLGEVLVGDETKHEIVAHLVSHVLQSDLGCLVRLGGIADDHNAVRILEFLKGVLGQIGDGRRGLPIHVSAYHVFPPCIYIYIYIYKVCHAQLT